MVFSQDEELFILYLSDNPSDNQTFPETFCNNAEEKVDKNLQKITGDNGGNSHDFFITDVSFSPDGSWIISSDRSGYLKIWCFKTRKLLSTIEAHIDEVTSIAFSPRGQFLATASYDENIYIWKTEELINPTSQPYKSFHKKSNRATPPKYAHEIEQVTSIVFSHDGKHIASGDQKGLVIIREVETGREISRKKIHNGHVRSLCFSPKDGGLLASASDDTRILLYDYINGNKKAETLGILSDKHTQALNSIAFSPMGDILVSSGKDGIIKLWNVSKRSLIRNDFPENDCSHIVDKVTFFPNRYNFATNCFAEDIRLWHISNEDGLTNIKINFD